MGCIVCRHAVSLLLRAWFLSTSILFVMLHVPLAAAFYVAQVQMRYGFAAGEKVITLYMRIQHTRFCPMEDSSDIVCHTRVVNMMVM